jgi:hypothetical protein
MPHSTECRKESRFVSFLLFYHTKRKPGFSMRRGEIKALFHDTESLRCRSQPWITVSKLCRTPREIVQRNAGSRSIAEDMAACVKAAKSEHCNQGGHAAGSPQISGYIRNDPSFSREYRHPASFGGYFPKCWQQEGNQELVWRTKSSGPAFEDHS